MNSQDRRGGDREHISFNVQFALDGENFKAGQGTDFSPSGMSMLTKGPIGQSSFVVRLVLPGQECSYEVELMWERRVEHEGQTWFRSGLKFGRAI